MLFKKIKEDGAIVNNVGDGQIRGCKPEDGPTMFNKPRKKQDEMPVIKRFSDYVEDNKHKDELEDGEEVLEGCSKGEKKEKKNMVKEYGKKEGEKIFFATKNKNKSKK
jgi:hypothetical protein